MEPKARWSLCVSKEQVQASFLEEFGFAVCKDPDTNSHLSPRGDGDKKLETLMDTFNPSEPLSSEFGIFGLPIKRHESKVILIPVPWEVTTSYGSGASLGPEAIRRASSQVDLFDLELGKSYVAGFYMEAINQKMLGLNNELKPFAQRVRDELEGGGLTDQGRAYQQRVNDGCKEMVDWVYQGSKRIISDEHKLVGIVGGDHSTPLGAIRAIAENLKKDYAIIHIDAHADLRQSYMGFTHSHASIMYNVMNSDFAPQKLVQVGVRDFCWEEADLIQRDERIRPLFSEDIKRRQFSGETWKSICDDILYGLPECVYISFDIDGLSPEFCPHTGTPVPGGLHFAEMIFLLNAIGHSGRRIVGFDLVEVAPGPDDDEWDGNVGARLLYRMCGWLAASNGLLAKPSARV